MAKAAAGLALARGPARRERPAISAGNGAPVAVTLLMVLAFMPITDRVDALSDALSPSRLVELGCIGLAVLLAGSAHLGGRSPASDRRPLALPAVTALFAMWAFVTALFSPMLMTGVVKALELLLITGAAYSVACLLSDRPDGGRTLLATGLVAAIATLLVANALRYGTPLPIMEIPTNRPRFMLGNTHPLASALLLAMAIVFLLTSRVTLWAKLPLLLAMAILLHLCDARGSTVGTVAGVLLVGWRQVPASPLKLLVGMTATIALAGAAVLAAIALDVPRLVIAFVGQDLTSLNGRLGLWALVLDLYAAHPIMGVGYFNSRLFLLPSVDWAGHAHNSALEILLSTGIVGFALFALFLLLWLLALVRTGDTLLLGLTPIILVEGSLNPVVFTPGIAMFLLTTALVSARPRLAGPAEARPGIEAAPISSARAQCAS